MVWITTYGEGGFDPSKPNNNIVEIREVPDDPISTDTQIPDVEIIAQALTQLPPSVLDALKQALGL